MTIKSGLSSRPSSTEENKVKLYFSSIDILSLTEKSGLSNGVLPVERTAENLVLSDRSSLKIRRCLCPAPPSPTKNILLIFTFKSFHSKKLNKPLIKPGSFDGIETPGCFKCQMSGIFNL